MAMKLKTAVSTNCVRRYVVNSINKGSHLYNTVAESGTLRGCTVSRPWISGPGSLGQICTPSVIYAAVQYLGP